MGVDMRDRDAVVVGIDPDHDNLTAIEWAWSSSAPTVSTQESPQCSAR
jgi:hypothetical protein